MIKSVGIDLAGNSEHKMRCLDEQGQLCDGFSFDTTPGGLAKFEERFDPQLAWVYYHEIMNNGKNHKQAMGAVMSHIGATILAVLHPLEPLAYYLGGELGPIIGSDMLPALL